MTLKDIDNDIDNEFDNDNDIDNEFDNDNDIFIFICSYVIQTMELK